MHCTKPLSKKGTAFVFKGQAVTSEIDSKVRIFSPFPRILEKKPDPGNLHGSIIKRAPDSIGVLYISKNCSMCMCISMKHMPSSVTKMKQQLASSNMSWRQHWKRIRACWTQSIPSIRPMQEGTNDRVADHAEPLEDFSSGSQRRISSRRSN